MLLLIISFIAGVLTILAPCILPLLPVIVGGSLSGGGINKKKAFTIILSLGVSVILFTLLLKASTLFIKVPENFWTFVSGGLIIFIGITSLLPAFWEGEWMARLNIKANMLLGRGEQKKSFLGDVIIGAALGPVFTTCSPTYFIILATVLPVTPVVGFVYLLTYSIGLCLALFLVSIVGQKVMTRLGIASDPHGWVKKTFGIIFIFVGIAVITGFDKKLQTSLLDGGIFDITKVEQKLLELNDKNSKKESADISGELESIEQKNKKYILAPEISTPDGFINTGGKQITLAELKGKKVVLLDIWTYSCINCIRTLPYIKAWYEKYKDQGLEIIGLHTPEFAFEKVLANVENAVKEFNLKHPVILDNDFSTWNAYGNQYWPRKYLIDIDGYVIYDHIGEGGYEETERAIQYALEERKNRLNMAEAISKDVIPEKIENRVVKSHEVYFGASRNEYLANGIRGKTGIQNLIVPESFKLNELYLGGSWNITSEYSESVGETDIVFTYYAKDLYMVASSPTSTEISIYRDGVFLKNLIIKDDELYTLIQGDLSGEHTIHIRVPKSGVKIFTFTFG